MSPQRRRFLFAYRFLASLALTVAMFSPAAALADDFETTVSNVVPSHIDVQSNGVSYHQTNGLANLLADVRVQIDTGAVGHVKSWKVWLGIAGQNSDSLWFPGYGKSKSYPWYDRPRSVDRTEHLIVPEVAWGDYVRARCNEMADDLRAQGLGNTAIFGRDRKVVLAVMATLQVDNTGAGSNSILVEANSWESETKIDLVCKKWSGASIPQASGDLTVVPAKVVNQGLSIVERASLNGACKIRLDGWITTDQKNATVKFRYKSQDGKQSQVWTVNTGASKTATFSHWYDVPNTAGSETGKVRMVGVGPDFTSAWADYAMNCIEGGPDHLAVNAPPSLTMAFVEQGKVMVHGQICPEKLKLVGKLEGHGSFSGYAAFVAQNGPIYISKPQAYSITHGQTVLVGADYPIDWSGTQPPAAGEPIRNDSRFDFNVTDDGNHIIAALKNRLHMVVCRRPALNPVAGGGPDGLAVQPRDALPGTPAAVKSLRLRPATPGAQPSGTAPRIILPQQRLKPTN